MFESYKELSTRQRCLHISLFVLFAIQNTIPNELPYFFYKSDMECLIERQWVSCKESEVCAHNYDYKFVNANGIRSVSMDFGLICDKKIIEATIIFLAPIASFLAFAATIFFEIPKEQKFKVIIRVLLVHILSFLLIDLATESLFFFVILFFIQNFGYSYIYSHFVYYIADTFPRKVSQNSAAIMNIVWPVSGLLFAASTLIFDSWMDMCIDITGIPLLIITCAIYFLTPKHGSNEDNIQIKEPLINSQACQDKRSQGVEEALNTKGNQKDQEIQNCQNQTPNQNIVVQKSRVFNELISKYQEIMKSKVLLKNICIYITVWVVSFMGLFTSLIAYTTIGGNIKHHVLFSLFAELVSGFVTIYVIKRYDWLKILYNNLLFVGIIQLLVILDYNSSFLTFITINISRFNLKITFAALMKAQDFMFPKKYTQLTFSLSNIVTIVGRCILPYYKYYMDMIEINLFFGLGILTLLCLYLIKSITIMTDPEKEDLANKKQEDIELFVKSPQKQNG